MLWIDMANDAVPFTSISAEGLTVGDVLACFQAGEIIYIHAVEEDPNTPGLTIESVEMIVGCEISLGEVPSWTFRTSGGSDYRAFSLDSVFGFNTNP